MSVDGKQEGKNKRGIDTLNVSLEGISVKIPFEVFNRIFAEFQQQSNSFFGIYHHLCQGWKVKSRAKCNTLKGSAPKISHLDRCAMTSWVLEILDERCLTWLLNAVELDACGAQSTQFKNIRKTQQQCLFTKIMSELPKIIHRPCCEQSHAGTIFYFYFLGSRSW